MAAESGHILIVDDDEVARYLLRRQLGSLTNAPVEEVTGGTAALAAIGRSIPRLVFLDLLMPEVAGDVVVRTAARTPRHGDAAHRAAHLEAIE